MKVIVFSFFFFGSLLCHVVRRFGPNPV